MAIAASQTTRPRSASESAPKYQVILDDLKQGITAGTFVPGQYLPSQNELMERYGVATGTVRQALMILSSEGWVRPEKGRGVFVQPEESRQATQSLPTGMRMRNVGFAVFGDFSEYEPELQVVLHGATAALQDSEFHLSYRIFPRDEQLLSRLSAYLEDLSSLIITRDVTPEVAEVVRDSGVKTVFLDFRSPGTGEHDGFNLVCCEADYSGHLAAHMLAAGGHRKLAVYSPLLESSEYVAASLAGMGRACREYEMPEPRVWFATDREKEEWMIHELIEDRETTGVIVFNDQPACRLIRDLRQNGIRVPQDKSVISIGGLPREQLSEPHLARVNRQYHRLGVEAARAAIGNRTELVQKSFGVSFEGGATLSHRSLTT